jgi:hypothetical protein
VEKADYEADLDQADDMRVSNCSYIIQSRGLIERLRKRDLLER